MNPGGMDCRADACPRLDRGLAMTHVRRTTQSPITSTSILVRRKQSSASAGVQTTGSFSLKLVFSTIGTPVWAWKALISAW